ncbi:hypothetical protein B0H13DRAFT_1884678 [Mycena leptocephala]|nr:hypothetical protein B0H13DRAFT_1884678 [Mycena leptocephala]
MEDVHKWKRRTKPPETNKTKGKGIICGGERVGLFQKHPSQTQAKGRESFGGRTGRAVPKAPEPNTSKGKGIICGGERVGLFQKHPSQTQAKGRESFVGENGSGCSKSTRAKQNQREGNHLWGRTGRAVPKAPEPNKTKGKGIICGGERVGLFPKHPSQTKPKGRESFVGGNGSGCSKSTRAKHDQREENHLMWNGISRTRGCEPKRGKGRGTFCGEKLMVRPRNKTLFAAALHSTAVYNEMWYTVTTASTITATRARGHYTHPESPQGHASGHLRNGRASGGCTPVFWLRLALCNRKLVMHHIMGRKLAIRDVMGRKSSLGREKFGAGRGAGEEIVLGSILHLTDRYRRPQIINSTRGMRRGAGC